MPTRWPTRGPLTRLISGYMLIATPGRYEIRQRLANGQPGALMGWVGQRELAGQLLAAFNDHFQRQEPRYV